MGASPALTQVNFRGKYDIGGLNSTDWIAALNTNFSVNTNTNFRIRFEIGEAAGQDYGGQIQYSKDGGAWTNVGAADSNVRPSDSPHFVDEEITTQQLSAWPDFTSGYGDDADAVTTVSTVNGSQNREDEFCMTILTPGSYQFRLTNEGTVFSAYSNTPTVTASAATAGTGFLTILGSGS